MEFDKEFFNNFSFAYNPTTKERYSSKLDIIKSKVDPASDVDSGLALIKLARLPNMADNLGLVGRAMAHVATEVRS